MRILINLDVCQVPRVYSPVAKWWWLGFTYWDAWASGMR